jgi:hypothetical protein
MIIYAVGDLKKMRNNCLRADSHGANKSRKTLPIVPKKTGITAWDVLAKAY